MQLTLNVTDEQLEPLKVLQEDFAYQQAHDQAPYPNVYVLVDYHRRPADSTFAGEDSRIEYCGPNGDICEILIDTLPTYLQTLHPKALAAFLADHPDFDWTSESDSRVD